MSQTVAKINTLVPRLNSLFFFQLYTCLKVCRELNYQIRNSFIALERKQKACMVCTPGQVDREYEMSFAREYCVGISVVGIMM